jgi:L-aspartate oxidase
MNRFPGITRVCKKFDIDITTDPIPVRPGAHYFIGGVAVDSEGQTSVPHLWAAGEVTASGLHGANRLASNSLLEGMVYGAHAGAAASRAALAMSDNFQALPITQAATSSHQEPLDLVDIRNSLKSLMWRNVGVRRSKSGLEDAATTIDRWCRYVLPCQFSDTDGWELQNMLTVAYFVIDAALAREETRGVHQRIDFPGLDEQAWRQHLRYQRSDRQGYPVRSGIPLEG